jgi:hypothetical protein
MSNYQKTALVYGLLVAAAIMFCTHAIIKLPSEAFWSSLQSIYENYALAMTLAFSLPYPYWSAGILLLLIAAVNYWIAYRILRWLGKKNRTSV